MPPKALEKAMTRATALTKDMLVKSLELAMTWATALTKGK